MAGNTFGHYGPGDPTKTSKLHEEMKYWLNQTRTQNSKPSRVEEVATRLEKEGIPVNYTDISRMIELEDEVNFRVFALTEMLSNPRWKENNGTYSKKTLDRITKINNELIEFTSQLKQQMNIIQSRRSHEGGARRTRKHRGRKMRKTRHTRR